MKNSLAVLLIVISLFLGSAATFFSGNRQTVTTTVTSTTTTTSSDSLFSLPTTFTTVSRTTLSFGGSTYSTTTGEYSGCIPPVQCYLTTVTYGINPTSQTRLNFFNETYLAFVNYSGAWGLSYETRLGTNASWGALINSGNFFGHNPTNESIEFSGNETLLVDYGYTTCIVAQKLDASNSSLVLSLSPSNSNNQTFMPYGTASVCIGYVYSGGPGKSQTVGNSTDLTCTATTFEYLGIISLTVQNGTTQKISSDTTSTVGETTFMTTTNATQSVGLA